MREPKDRPTAQRKVSGALAGLLAGLALACPAREARADSQGTFRITHLAMSKSYFYFLVSAEIPDSTCAYKERFGFALSEPASASLQSLITAAFLSSTSVVLHYTPGECVGLGAQAFSYLRTSSAKVP